MVVGCWWLVEIVVERKWKGGRGVWQHITVSSGGQADLFQVRFAGSQVTENDYCLACLECPTSDH
jgi:hypothetical protein